MMTCESTKQIFESLEFKYESKEFAIRKLLNNLRDLPRLKSRDIGLIAFASEVKNNVATLNSLGNGHLFDSHLIANILRKVPKSMVYEYNEFATRHRPFT